MCDLDCDDYPSVWNETPRRARKEHRCSACHATIAVGDRYVSCFYVVDGYAYSECACLPCEETRAAFRTAHRAGMSPAEHADELRDCIAEDPGDKAKTAQWRRALAGVLRRRRAAGRARKAVA